MPVVSNPDQRAMATFAAQEGAISLRQARVAGLSDDQVVNRCVRGLWRRRVRGVYVLAGSPDTPRQRAMVAFLATADAGGVVSHLTAAAMHGLTSFPTLPHVTVPPSASADSRSARVHRGTVPAGDRTRRGGLVMTSPSRTLADCAVLVDRATLEELVDVAFCRKLATRDSTLAAAARAGRRRRGGPLLRSVVEVWSPAIEPGRVAEVRLCGPSRSWARAG